ncbi:MAG TPA: carboxypeptidase-like regulatory domain-containing protein, partial [Chitinophagaceae bacterium]|nr:carboxypeptidase-like regulatory domain-containing protein [Chitinophagaceae bacterium]
MRTSTLPSIFYKLKSLIPATFCSKLLLGCFILLVSSFSTQLQAQGGKLTGKLMDEKNAPVPYANITLLKAADSALTANALSDSTGNFFIATPLPGTYFLRFTAIGFDSKQIPHFEVSNPEFSK